jgi:hypothetical protein
MKSRVRDLRVGSREQILSQFVIYARDEGKSGHFTFDMGRRWQRDPWINNRIGLFHTGIPTSSLPPFNRYNPHPHHPPHRNI